ncbi:C4-dicarboxylate ABC transporter [Meiothermus granaticius NBRC 107808]|uniref:C4-dicarboxylate TRAP transporter large permease protein DctM n=2 Tax=Meiothermus TaxID=65551 RepID=A0A399F866_9DEIN|nr:TRAP transporter large permease subunit [Meiothermus granaticius]RIH92428.1 C4-dicarboxylate TRAP transporter large permease protein DctM [Meiothermus granaticius NBRC 107808]GEM87463.1 C4-dicarboxylate ABC transporter [Meiothermus granaticius NBRC 107808]
MSFEIMAPLMFVGLIVFLLLGYPVAFSLGAVGLLFGWIGVRLDFLQPVFLQNIPFRIFDTMQNQTLLAIPFFTFMGLILERSGMAEDLLDTMGQLFGRLRGGIAYAVVIVGAMLAATTGVVAASVIAMGLISLPVMLRYGYSPRIAAGTIAASGTLAQIIPPSLVLIILADQLRISVGDIYRGAFLPGLIISGLYMAYILIVSFINPKAVPALPAEVLERRGRGQPLGPQLLQHGLFTLGVIGVDLWLTHWANPVTIGALILANLLILWIRRSIGEVLARRAMVALVPPLVLIFLVLGTIFLGIATPTEGGAMGATGALLLAIVKRKFSLRILLQAMEATARLTSFVAFILVGSRIFSLVFVGVRGDEWVEGLLKALPGGEVGFLVVVNLFIFFIAFFLDYFEIAFIIIPLIGPVAESLGINLVWFGVMIGVNLQTSFMHPPFGFALFYLRSVAPPSLKTSSIYWGAIPFVLIQLIMVFFVIFNPWIVTNWISK